MVPLATNVALAVHHGSVATVVDDSPVGKRGKANGHRTRLLVKVIPLAKQAPLALQSLTRGLEIYAAAIHLRPTADKDRIVYRLKVHVVKEAVDKRRHVLAVHVGHSSKGAVGVALRDAEVAKPPGVPAMVRIKIHIAKGARVLVVILVLSGGRIAQAHGKPAHKCRHVLAIDRGHGPKRTAPVGVNVSGADSRLGEPKDVFCMRGV